MIKQPFTGVIANETSKTATTYYYLPFSGYDYEAFSVQLAASGTITMTIEVSSQTGATQSALTYVDRTNTLTGSASLTAAGLLESSGGKISAYNAIRIKVVSTSATYKIDVVAA